MLDLLTALYDLDALRFAAWDALATIGMADTLVSLLNLAGITVWEDWSITR